VCLIGSASEDYLWRALQIYSSSSLYSNNDLFFQLPMSLLAAKCHFELCLLW